MSQRKRLVATWRRAVRAVAGSGYKEDVAPLLKELMIDPIEHRWAQHVAVTTFRCRYGTAPPDLRKKLKSVDHGRTTRGTSGNYYPGQKKRTIIEIRGEKNAVPRVISCSIRRDQRRASPIRDCPRLLPCADRAWSSMISHVEQRSFRCESRGWFFFFFGQGSMCHTALPQPLEQYLFPIVLPLFGALFPTKYKKQVLLIVLKGSTWNCYQILILPMLWTLRSIVIITKSC